MNTDELVQAMRRTEVPSIPDLDRITRNGRRLARRRRAAAGAVALACCVAVVTPFALDGTAEQSATPAVGYPSTVSRAHPMGKVAYTHDKFYWGRPHAPARGPEAIWVEQGDPAYRIAFGFRDPRTGRLMRADAMTVPSRTGGRVQLPAIPRQTEPTYVGMFRLPTHKRAKDYSVAVEIGPNAARVSTDVRQSGTVRPGYLVFWVTSSADLASSHGWYAVEDRRGTPKVSGGFQPQPQAPATR